MNSQPKTTANLIPIELAKTAFHVTELEEWLEALSDFNAFDDWEIVTDRHHLPFRSPV